MGIFKAYDIRGVYPDELDEEIAEKIGAAAAHVIGGKTIVVGRDMRLSGQKLAEAVIRGLLSAGKDVVDIGEVTSPMVTFAVAKFGYDGGVMVTASHNPGRYNGAKLCAHDAEPISYGTGIDRIEQMIASGDIPKADTPGKVAQRDVLPDYLAHLWAHVGNVSDIKLVIDTGNGMAGKVLTPLLEKIDVEMVPLYFEIDGTFPNHEANPLKPENLVDLQKKVVEAGADFGAAFDGDGDRVMFVDEKGNAVSADMVTALIGLDLLRDHPGSTILYDLRSSWAVREELETAGGKPLVTRVGHSFIKATMREKEAIFGGELSGHYYYRDNFYCDSGAFTLLKVLTLLCRKRTPLSQLIAPLARYAGSGEINSEVVDKEAKIEELAAAYADGRQSRLDGLSVEFDDWWFNVRPSNTEPVLRLVVEARSREHMALRRDTLVRQIRRGFAVRKVLFTTDFSPYAQQALPFAMGIARDYGAALHVLHVVPTPELAMQFEPVAPVLDPGLFAGLEEAAREHLEVVITREMRKDVPIQLAVRRGAAFVEIVRYAKEEKIDLIVLATHGRTGIPHALFGSVAEKVVRKAPCAVLSVRPAGHQFEMP